MRPAAELESLPNFIPPMLLVAAPPPSPGVGEWAVEVKFDGIRAQLRVDRGRGWRVRSRPGRDCSPQFPELSELAAARPPPGAARRRARPALATGARTSPRCAAG